MITQPHITREHIDEPFSEMVAYTLDHRKLVLEIRVTPKLKQPPHIVIADEFTRRYYEPRCEETRALTDTIKAYYYKRICIEASEEYTYWLRLIIVDSTALVPHPEQFPDPDHVAERQEHWTIIPQLEQVREIPVERVENR